MTSKLSLNAINNCYLDDFAWIGPCHQHPWHPEFETFNSVEALLEQGRTVELIVLSLQAEEQDKCLRALRKNDSTF